MFQVDLEELDVPKASISQTTTQQKSLETKFTDMKVYKIPFFVQTHVEKLLSTTSTRRLTPYEYFKYLITDELIDLTVEQSNNCAQQKDGKVLNVSLKLNNCYLYFFNWELFISLKFITSMQIISFLLLCCKVFERERDFFIWYSA